MKEFFKRMLTDIEEESHKNRNENEIDAESGAFNRKRFFITLLLLASLAVLLYQQFGYMLPSEVDTGDILYFAIMSGLVSFWVASDTIQLKKLGRTLVLWGSFALVLMTAYSYRFEIQQWKDRLLGNLSPHHGVALEERSLSFPLDSDGHFYIVAHVNQRPLRFLVDTGASHIIFPPRAAEALGFDLDRLSFIHPFQTANGRIYGAPIELQNIRVGGFYLSNVSAFVNESPMDYPLLGMTFFKELKRYQVENGMLTLHW